MITHDDWTARVLARQAHRRRGGLATVSLLPGSPSHAARLWATANVGCATVSVPAHEFSVIRLCRAVAFSLDLRPAAAAELRRRGINCPPAGATIEDWRRACRKSAVGHDDVSKLAEAICLGAVSDSVLSLPVERLIDQMQGPALTALEKLLSPGTVAVWIDGLAAKVHGIAEQVAAAAFAAPTWGIAGAIGSPDILWLSAGASRTRSLLLTGVIPEPPPGLVAKPGQWIEQDDFEPAADEFKSHAERRLFEALQSDPRTAGLFAVNVKLDFKFGPGWAEADLFSAALRLAVEVDGYHHFLSSDGYRRDRRKDWAYRSHGYRVARELAEDVMEDLPGVVDRVAQKVQDCRVHQPGQQR